MLNQLTGFCTHIVSMKCVLVELHVILAFSPGTLVIVCGATVTFATMEWRHCSYNSVLYVYNNIHIPCMFAFL